MAEIKMSENDLRSIYRRYELKELLKAINRETYRIAYDQENRLVQGLKQIDIKMKMGNSSFAQKETKMITAWDLIDVAYYAVQYTNEFRGKNVVSENDLVNLLTADDLFKEQRQDRTISHVSGTNHFNFYLWGFVGEQIRFQTISQVFDNAVRDMYILLSLAQKIGIDYIDKVINEEVNAPWYVVVSVLYLTWVGFQNVNELEEMLPWIKWNEEFTKDTFTSIVEKYSVTYTEIRESGLKRQIFYTKPYIKTKSGIISINCFLNLFAYEHCLYWIVRNAFFRANNQQFINDFGKLFEKYFSEILQTYLNKWEYSQIEPDDRKALADWRMDICGFTFLIEQKSSLMKLSIKQQDTDVEEFEKYFEKIIEAIRQLHSNEQNLEKKCIKIILLYEDYIKPELLDEVFQLEKCEIENDHMYWLITINEMERLLYLYKYKQTDFINVVNEKIRRENGLIEPGESKALDRLLFMHDKAENHHMKKKQFKEYSQFIEQYIKRLVY